MQGQLQEIDVHSLLQLIELDQRTGELWIEAEQAWLLSFSQGRLVHASPVNCGGERLGDFLHRIYPDFCVEAEQAVGHFDEVRGELKAGQSLINQDWPALHLPEYQWLWSMLADQRLTLKQCQTLIKRLVDETLFDLLGLCEGRFCFELNLSPPAAIVALDLSPRLAIVRQQLQAWKQLYPLIESPEQRPILVKPERLSQQLSGSAFKNLARWADGRLSLRRLSRRLNRPMTAVAQAIYPFVEAHFIQLRLPLPQGRSLTPSREPPSLEAPSSMIAYIGTHPAPLDPLNHLRWPRSCDVVSFTDPLVALPTLFEQRPNLIVCDVDLPVLDGYELCAMLRQTHHLRDRPIILLSEQNGFIARAQARLAGATDYLEKPFGTDELLMLLEKYIDLSLGAKGPFHQV